MNQDLFILFFLLQNVDKICYGRHGRSGYRKQKIYFVWPHVSINVLLCMLFISLPHPHRNVSDLGVPPEEGWFFDGSGYAIMENDQGNDAATVISLFFKTFKQNGLIYFVGSPTMVRNLAQCLSLYTVNVKMFVLC